jgi:hypothetical protein
MKRITFLKASATIFMLVAFLSFSFGKSPAKQMYYEIKMYRIGGTNQEARMDAFLKDAYLPAMHRAGISKIGVFKPVEQDTAFGKYVYVFIPFKTLDQYLEIEAKLAKDQNYMTAGKEFIDAPYNDPPFVRYENILLKAFAFMPEFKTPVFTTPMSDRIYELRSYESATEAKATKKIEMFNEGGEIGIFEKIGANPVFFGQVLMGSKMPRLMYMTTYANMKAHDDCWAAFRNHADWKKISTMEEYKNTVSKVNPYLLHPTSYSDF